MNYQSISQLTDHIRVGLWKIPSDVDLVVGIPRSGVLAASIVSLFLNLPFCDLGGLIRNDRLKNGQTRAIRYSELRFPSQARHILILDDSIDTGNSVAAARKAVEQLPLGARVTYAAIYATAKSRGKVDLFFTVVPMPRVFEWNIMHRDILGKSCVDIDGVLCHDPLPRENDDGENYKKFLMNAKPLIVPTQCIGHLVSNRLEKYRPETEQWLKKNGIAYRELHLLGLANAQERREIGDYAAFKASIYAQMTDTVLFIESEPQQARGIAEKTGKPVLCFELQQMIEPGFSLANLKFKSQSRFRNFKKISSRVMRKINLHGA